MKKWLCVLLCCLFSLMTSCLNKKISSKEETIGEGRSEPVFPVLTEELILSGDKICRIEPEIYHDALTEYRSYPTSDTLDPEKRLSYCAPQLLYVTASVVSIESHCVNFDDRTSDLMYEYHYNKNVPYIGYTVTKLEIEDVADAFTRGRESFLGLIGRTVTARQPVFWYYDDQGELKKASAYEGRYSYCLAPGREALVCLSVMDKKTNRPLDAADFAEITCEELLEWLNENGDRYTVLSDYYPPKDQNGERFLRLEQIRDYLLWLNDQNNGLYNAFAKKNEIKDSLSY